MTISKELFINNLNKFNISINDSQLEMFDKYAEMLITWNKKFNLTAIKEPDDIVIKHFVDSLTVMSEFSFESGKKLIDVGTGAGFPGIPLLIMNNDLKATFLDSTGKKISFINAVLDELGLDGETLNCRAEEAANDSFYREKFDYSTARAVSELRNIAEFCLPFVKIGGTFISMKGARAQEEIDLSNKAITVLGGKIEKIQSFEIDSCGERTLIFIKKMSQTPTKYPRNYSQITKNPIV